MGWDSTVGKDNWAWEASALFSDFIYYKGERETWERIYECTPPHHWTSQQQIFMVIFTREIIGPRCQKNVLIINVHRSCPGESESRYDSYQRTTSREWGRKLNVSLLEMWQRCQTFRAALWNSSFRSRFFLRKNISQTTRRLIRWKYHRKLE